MKNYFYALFFLIAVLLITAQVSTADSILYQQEREWVNESAVMVDIAGEGKAKGKVFVQRVRAHRGELRKLMRASGKAITPAHRQLHMSMVLMGILLKTASGCQTGGFVVCPPMLMTQLRTVLKNTNIKLAALEERAGNKTDKTQIDKTT